MSLIYLYTLNITDYWEGYVSPYKTGDVWSVAEETIYLIHQTWGNRTCVWIEISIKVMESTI